MTKRKPLCVVASLVAATLLTAEEIKLSSCPDPVRATIQAHLHRGELDDIKRIEVEDRVLFLVEIDLKGFRDLILHIAGSGKLLKSVEEMRLPDLPPPIREAVGKILVEKGRVEEIEKVITDGRTEYHVEIERPKLPDVKLVFDEIGTLLSQK